MRRTLTTRRHRPSPPQTRRKIADYTTPTSVETQAEFLRRFPDRRATHTAEIGNLYYTASNPAANPAGMTNRAPRGKRNNARLAKPSAVKARDPIPAGREILLAYGSDYNI